MASKLQDLIAKKAELEQQIVSLQREEKSAAIAQVKSLMSTHGLSMADLNTRIVPVSKGRTGVKVPPKYRDPASGQTWSGRGLHPKWLKEAMSRGAKLTDFAL